ncbi:UNVERIFIED_CONTAM: Translocase of chloroplast, chloroplastic [Sesamum radiatum]|uniref:Translocase of chloroplast, chloroplastic n=1 Tax=Sesamum radiatum TaxID=300843 RepID=A0AAW2IJ67_SESRA
MDPKEATAYPVSEASSGYTTSSSPPYSDSFETETLLNKTVGLNYYSGSNGKGTVSEDEDYASGKEEFETGLDNPVLDEGKAIGEGNYDASAKLESLPVSGVMVNDDDDVGKATGSEEDKVSGFGGLMGRVKVWILADKLGVNSNEVVVEKSDEVVDGNEGKVVVEEVEINEGESEKEGKSGSLSIGMRWMKLNIQVDVAGPGVAVVGETEENGVVPDKPEEKEVVDVAAIEPGKTEVVSLVDVAPMPEGDSVVDTIQVDVPNRRYGRPGVAIVGETEENRVKIEGVRSTSIAESSKDVLESKTLEPEHYVVGDENGEKSDAGTVVDLVNGVHESPKSNDSIANDQLCTAVFPQNDGLADRVSEELELTASAEPKAALNPQEIREVGDEIDEEVHPEDSTSDEDTDGADSSFEQSQRLDGQIVTDSEEEGDTDDEGDGKELFDSAALAALLKAANWLFSVERPTGLGSSLRSLRPAPRPTRPNLFSPAPASGGESEDNLSEEEKKKLEKLQQIRVKFLRLVHRLGLSPEESVAAQLEAGESDDLDFSVDILCSWKIWGFNRSVLSSVKKFTKKSSPDVVLYVDRLDAQSRDLNDLPLFKTVTSALGSSIWRSAIVTLTHAASAPPDGPSGSPLSYEVFVSQRSHVVQQSIGHAVGDLRMMSPSLMNPVSLVENHPSCRKNREGQKILPNGQSWRPQLLLLCYSMKILSEASSLSKPQDPFDHRKLFGFRARAPPLPYMLSSMLQSRAHPKLPSDQGGENVDSDIDLDDLSDSDQEEEDI